MIFSWNVTVSICILYKLPKKKWKKREKTKKTKCKSLCRDWVPNSRPLDYKADALPIEPQKVPIDFVHRIQKSLKIQSKLWFSVQNLSMIPASDQKTNGKNVKAYSLSYNILKFQRKSIKDKWATAPRTLACQIRILTTFNSHRHYT